MIEFPLGEYEARMAGLTRRMRAAGLDGVMITNRENTRYYCDLQSVIWPSKVSTPGILILNADGRVRLVGSASAVETARHTCCLDPQDVTCYDRNDLPGVPATYPDAVIESVRALGLAGGRIGMEYGEGAYLQLQLHWLEEITSRLPEAEFVDAMPLILRQRMIKSPAEIEALRTACRQNEQSLQYAFSHVEPGRSTEFDFFRLYAQQAFRLHCENVTNDLAPLSVRFGAGRAAAFGSPCGETVLPAAPHAPVAIDGGLYTHGYYSDLSRSAVVGGLSDRQRALADAARETCDLLVSLIRAGAPAAEVTARTDRFALASAAGDRYLSRGALGHGVGLDLREAPYLKKLARDGGAFEAGMVLSLHPRFGGGEDGVFCCGREVVVMEDGAQCLGGDGEPFVIA